MTMGTRILMLLGSCHGRGYHSASGKGVLLLLALLVTAVVLGVIRALIDRKDNDKK